MRVKEREGEGGVRVRKVFGRGRSEKGGGGEREEEEVSKKRRKKDGRERRAKKKNERGYNKG